MRHRSLFILSALCFAVTPACALDRDMEGEGESDGVEQAEKWGAADDPAIFTPDAKRKLADLPDQGEAAQIPWAGSYWPVYEDSINHKWDGASSDSASKKYEKAFNATNVEDAVSKYHGVESRTEAKVCKEDSECDSALGEKCGKRDGKTEGRCIPSWWGICHAWGPASILMPEPKHEVVKNGVTFKVQDIKALATLVHNRTTTKFVSLRCNKNAQKDEVKTDEYGRPIDSECKDTNAGTYHLLLANYLGIKKQSFVEDRTMDYQVWNQPMRGYKVLEKRSVTLDEAHKMLNVGAVGGTTVKKAATIKKDEWTHQGSFDVTPGGNYKVMMSGTGDADLHVHFGEQPTDAKYTCRPYGGTSTEECVGVVPAGATKMFVSAKGYADSSAVDINITTGGSAPTTYVFNKDAKAWSYFKTQVQYISEASSSTDGNLSTRIDTYTHNDTYEYILELDAAGNIIGGEWVGSSRMAHPDFVWLPLGAGTTSVAGGAITYANVKAIVDESVKDNSTPPASTTEETVNESGKLAKNEEKKLGPYKVAAGGKLVAETTGTGDVDLYVKKGTAPTTSSYDCRPYKSGSKESCTSEGGTDVFVTVRGYAATSDFKVTIKYTKTQ
jgi:hypothetical protein